MSKLPACPACGKINDTHVAMEQDLRPESGDLTICAYCLSINGFTDDLSLAPLSLKAQLEALDDPSLGPMIKRARLEMRNHQHDIAERVEDPVPIGQFCNCPVCGNYAMMTGSGCCDECWH